MSKSVNVDFVTRQIEVDTDGKEHFISAAMAAKDAEQSMLNAQNAANSVKKYKALWFDSVAAMKAEPSLTAGAYVNTAGYYEPNDGGGASYLIREKLETDIDDGGSIHLLANGLVAELIVKNGAVNVKQFGAKGDGISDDTNVLQACLYISYNKKWNVYIQAGEYLHKSLVIPANDSANNVFSMTVFGDGIDSTKLKHIDSGVGVRLQKSGTIEEGYIDGVTVYGLSLYGNDATTDGLVVPKGTKINIFDIKISQFNNIGFNNTDPIWVCSFNNIFIETSSDNQNSVGFKTANGSTTLNIDNVYVFGTKNKAYSISGNYSNIGALSADFCSGVNVYEFTNFNGGITSLGCEHCSAKIIISCSNSDVKIDNIKIFEYSFEDIFETAFNFIYSGFSLWRLVFSSSEKITVSKPLIIDIGSKIDLGYIDGDVVFSDYIIHTNSDADIISVQKINDVYNVGYNVRGADGRSFIGQDRVNIAAASGLGLQTNKEHACGIFLSCTTDPWHDKDGKSIVSKTYAGDWFIEANPNEKCVAAYVTKYTSWSGQAQSASSLLPIPFILSGTTQERPQRYITGMCFFDTTLGKPIWCKSSGVWVDATGATV